MAHPNAELIEKFYRAFQQKDAEAMAACYHPDVHFWDPVFQDLKGFRAGAMWRMLCERGKDLQIQYSNIKASDTSGEAHWDADYTFSATGRKVHNVIDARFEFKDGLIVKHTDSFDLPAWMAQAFGVLGVLMGRLGFFQSSFRKRARQGLEDYIAKRGLS